MDPIRLKLLDNYVDALDRLFDRKSNIIEIHALTFATAQAVKGDALAPLFESTAQSLLAIGEKLLWSSLAREEALAATNDLRIAVAEALPDPLL